MGRWFGEELMFGELGRVESCLIHSLCNVLFHECSHILVVGWSKCLLVYQHKISFT